MLSRTPLRAEAGGECGLENNRGMSRLSPDSWARGGGNYFVPMGGPPCVRASQFATILSKR